MQILGIQDRALPKRTKKTKESIPESQRIGLRQAIFPLPETPKMAPEHGWLGDENSSFWG